MINDDIQLEWILWSTSSLKINFQRFYHALNLPVINGSITSCNIKKDKKMLHKKELTIQKGKKTRQKDSHGQHNFGTWPPV